MTTNLNPLVRTKREDESRGRHSRQRIAVEKRPFPHFCWLHAKRLFQQSNLHRQNCPFRLLYMRRGIVIAAILLMTLGAASSVFACLPPQQEMAAAAHGCCKPLASSCSSGKVPSSEACCDKEAPNGSSVVVTVNEPAHALHVIATSDVDVRANELASSVAAIDHPPDDSASSSSILRI